MKEKYLPDAPPQVIAFVCCFVTTFLMIAACATTEWIMTEGFREGLFEQCVKVGAPTPIPFTKPGEEVEPGCFRAHGAGQSRSFLGQREHVVSDAQVLKGRRSPSVNNSLVPKKGYVRGTAALVVVVVLTDFFGTLLTGLGLRSTDPNKKYKYYRVASWSLVLASE